MRENIGSANLSGRLRRGTAERILLFEEDGKLYPESIRIKKRVRCNLKRESFLRFKSKILRGDRSAEIFFYLDDVLRWIGWAGDSEEHTVIIDGAKELRIEVRAKKETEIILLSPCLWWEKYQEEEGIREFELYEYHGMDPEKECALSGIVVEKNNLVFVPECLEYRLPKQQVLKIRAMALDPEAQIKICGIPVKMPKSRKILEMDPVMVRRESCGGIVMIEVRSRSREAVRMYKIYF